MLHDLGIAAHNHHSSPLRGIGHGADLGFQNVRRKARFQHIADYQGDGPRSRNRQVVHSPVHGEFPN